MSAMLEPQSTNLTIALEYAARGWYVLPCYIPDAAQPGGCSCGAKDCAQIGKHPSPQHGLLQAKRDTRQITSWWRARPLANIAIRTGAVSGFIALDIDPKHDGPENLATLEAQLGALPATLTSLTGSSGRHYLFRHPGGRVCNDATGKLAGGIDVRGDEGYIVAPPSQHVSGRQYVWLNDLAIAELPPAWVALLPRPKERHLAVVPAQGGDEDAEHWLDQALLRARDGNRNLTGFWLACQLRDSGLDEGTASDCLQRYAMRLGGDYTVKEALHSVDTAYSQPAREPAISQAPRATIRIVSRGLVVDEETGEVLEDTGEESVSEDGDEEDDQAPIDKLPQITVTNRRGRDIALEALDALGQVDALYHCGGVLVRTKNDDYDRLITEQLSPDALRGMLDRCADFLRLESKKTKTYVFPTLPPMSVVKDVLSLPAYPFRAINGIVQAPIVRADGSILFTPGYDAQSRVIYNPPADLTIPPLPPAITEEHITAARSLLLDELLGDFPFVNQSDKAHAIAMILTPLVRDYIQGATPLFIVDAPTPGSGKGLLADICCLPAFGLDCGDAGTCGDDDEWRKQITSMLLNNRRVIRFDNITTTIDSPSLARALTTSMWEDRVLGGNTMARLAVRVTWMATGNNITTSTEIARRVVHCRLDANVERPESRKDFKHSPLRLWAAHHRGDLLAAALTLIQAWFAADKPASNLPEMGSFESWCTVVGGILQHAGIPGFLTQSGEEMTTDNESLLWQEFTQLWWRTYRNRIVQVGELLELAIQANMPLRSSYVLAQRVELGIALRRERGRIFGDYKVCCKVDNHTKGNRWWLLDSAGTSPSNAGTCGETAGTSLVSAGSCSESDDQGMSTKMEF